MGNKNVNEVINILREKESSGNYIYEFVINYYLSRKLKNNTFNQILDKIEDENIKYNLRAVYEEENNYIEQFNNLKDFSLDEIVKS